MGILIIKQLELEIGGCITKQLYGKMLEIKFQDINFGVTLEAILDSSENCD